MRKGFTLTLTALATVLLATSALALGPLVQNVPDVFISSADETTNVNMFRYSDALVLWDYVTPGVTSGTGSTSHTLYWTWAAKNADYATGLGTGPFLDPATAATDPNGIHYSIAQQNGAVVDPILPTGANIVDWTAEINAAPLLASHGLDVAGALTFRNIRLSPPPDLASYPAPVAMPGTLPAGVLDFQEATLFATDGATSPQATNTNPALLISVDTGVDRLSGGPSWIPDKVVTSSPAVDWGTAPFTLYAPMAGNGIAAVASTQVTGTNNLTGTINVNAQQLVNANWDASHDAYHFGGWLPLGSAVIGTANPFAAGTLYRIQARVASSNATVATNPTLNLGLNARGTIGYGYTLVNQAAPFGPTTGGAITLNGYLVPAVQGDANLWFGVYDPSAPNNSGNITFSNIKISHVDLASLVKVSDRKAVTTVNASDFTYFGIAYSFFNAADAIVPTYNHAPTSGSGLLSLTAATTGSPVANCRGFGVAQFSNYFTVQNAGDLIVAKAMLTGSGASVPDTLLKIQDNGLFMQGSFYLTPNGSSGPNATSKAFYVAIDVPAGLGGSSWDFALYTTVDRDNCNGTVNMQSLTISEYQQPAE
jgi:hypothetical protein